MPNEDDRVAVRPEVRDQPVHHRKQIAGILDKGRARSLEVLPLHVDDEERHLPILQGIDHAATPRSLFRPSTMRFLPQNLVRNVGIDLGG